MWTQAASCTVPSSWQAYFYACNCNIIKKIFFTLCWRILMLSQLRPLILLRKCVCPSTHAPLGMIPVVGKLGSYSNVQHKKYDRCRVEIVLPSVLRIPLRAPLSQYSSELWASKQAHQDPPSPHAPSHARN